MSDILKTPSFPIPPTTYDCAYEHSMERYFSLEKLVEEADRETKTAEPKLIAKAAGAMSR